MKWQPGASEKVCAVLRNVRMQTNKGSVKNRCLGPLLDIPFHAHVKFAIGRNESIALRIIKGAPFLQNPGA